MDDEAARTARMVWELGDYAALAERLAPAAAQLGNLVGPGDGSAAVDVATGTGSLARVLAGSGWQVSATDIAPSLIAQGRRAADAAGLDIDWHEARMDALPLDDGSVDLVGSSFGLIFASDPVQVLSEMRRVLRPGGLLAYTAWTSSSYIAEMTRVMATFMPPGPSINAPFRWGEPSATSSWLNARGYGHVIHRRYELPWRFESPESATSFMFENSPGHIAASRYVGDRAAAMRTAVHDHLTSLAEPDGSIDISAEYLVTTAQPVA